MSGDRFELNNFAKSFRNYIDKLFKPDRTPDYDQKLEYLINTLPNKSFELAEKYLNSYEFSYKIFDLKDYPRDRDPQIDVLVCLFTKYFTFQVLSQLDSKNPNDFLYIDIIFRKALDLFLDGKSEIYLNILAEMSVSYVGFISGGVDFRYDLNSDPTDSIATAIELIDKKLTSIKKENKRLGKTNIIRNLMKVRRILDHNHSFLRFEG